jgi:PAS domain S-box-containing protein
MPGVLTALIQNAALLLAMMVVFDLVSRRKTMLDQKPQQILAGLVLGGLCLGLMHSAFRLETGILFDTRSVLLSLSGLFFGVIPTVLAMTMAAAFRFWQGGAGTWMGVSVILTTGGIGLLWRHYRRERLEDISVWELYGFGVVVHLVMLALMLTLPAGAAWRVFEGIALPVMLVYPAATVALGGLLANHLSRENASGLLTASEEMYRHLFQKHAAVKMLIDPEDGRIVDANEAAAAFYGWPLDTLRRMSISEINTLPAAQIKAEMAKAREDKRVYSEFRHRLADGSVRDVAVYSSKVDVAGKELLHAIVHDITEGKRAEAALQASEMRYRSLFECAQDGILILDAETGKVVDVNPYLLHLLGHDRDALVGKPLWDIGPFHDIAASRDLFRVLQEKEYVRYEHLPLQGASGKLVDVEFVSNVYLANNLKVIQCNIRDITERKCAEEALNREHAMLARTEAAAHVGSWEWEAEGDTVTWSDELFRIFGLEPADEAPPFAEHQAFYVPEDRARLARAVEECVTNGISYDLEVRVLRRDGELRHCLVRGFPERDTDGAVKRLYGSLQDITEIRRAEERITTLSYMLDDAPASITIHDTEGRFLFANAATVSLHGYESMAEFMEVDLHDLDVPESEALLAERFRKIAEEGEARFEVEHYRKDGSTFPLDVLAKQIEWEGRPAILSIAADITERRMAEDRLRRSYDLLKNLAAQVPGVIYQYRLFPDGRSCFPYASPGMWTIYEVTPEEVEQNATPVFGRLHPEDADQVSEAISESARTLETFYCEFRVVLPEQGLCWRWSQAEPQRTEGGGTLWHGIILDITDRKQAEEALRHSHELMQYIIEHSNGGVAVHDRDLRYTFVSQRYLKDYGVQEPDIIGKHHYDVFPDLPEKWREIHRKALAGEVSRAERDPYERADGTVGWTRWECRPWYEKAGDIGGIIVYTEVITERVKAEETLIRQQRSIELSNRIANVFLTSSGGEVFADVLDIILQALDSRFGYFGYIDEAGDLVCPSLTRDVYEQCQVAEKSIVFPRAGWGGLWGRSLMGKQTLVANENLQLPEGHVTLENALAVPIVHQEVLIGQFVVANKAGGYDKDDRGLLEIAAAQTAPILFGIQETARQETAHSKLQEQLNQAQKMESVGRLAGGVAHDFNNMLNVILGHSELALDDLAEDSPLRDGIEEIRKAAERSANLTRQLLAFARRQTIAPRDLDLNETIASMLKMLERLIGEDIDLLWKPGTRLDLVRIDPGQLDQMLANLTVNARDAIGHRNGKITIETGNVCFDEEYCADNAGFLPGDYVVLAVSDDGCGMDEETRAQIFEPFFTTKGVGKGTGLGLSTIYGIVKQNNGFVNVYSEPGEGTTFRIYLPAIGAESRRHEEVRGADTHPVGGKETILVVEDEAAILNLARTMLERLGYTVLTAGTPTEARQLAQEQSGRIHLVITDVVMPEMNGRDVTNSLKEYCPHIRCLFMSGYTANVIAHQGVLDEGVNFIQKPFSPRDLARKVREVLDS